MTEQWNPLPALPDTYEISDLGNIRRKGRTKPLSPYINKTLGYAYVQPMVDLKRHCLSVHRQLALAFIPNPDNLPEVDHINRDRADYRLENLRWVSRGDNELNTGARKTNIASGEKFINNRVCGKHWWLKINNATLKYSKFFKKSDYTLEQVVAERNRICEEAGLPT